MPFFRLDFWAFRVGVIGFLLLILAATVPQWIYSVPNSITFGLRRTCYGDACLVIDYQLLKNSLNCKNGCDDAFDQFRLRWRTIEAFGWMGVVLLLGLATCIRIGYVREVRPTALGAPLVFLVICALLALGGSLVIMGGSLACGNGCYQYGASVICKLIAIAFCFFCLPVGLLATKFPGLRQSFGRGCFTMAILAAAFEIGALISNRWIFITQSDGALGAHGLGLFQTCVDNSCKSINVTEVMDVGKDLKCDTPENKISTGFIVGAVFLFIGAALCVGLGVVGWFATDLADAEERGEDVPSTGVDGDKKEDDDEEKEKEGDEKVKEGDKESSSSSTSAASAAAAAAAGGGGGDRKNKAGGDEQEMTSPQKKHKISQIRSSPLKKRDTTSAANDEEGENDDDEQDDEEEEPALIKYLNNVSKSKKQADLRNYGGWKRTLLVFLSLLFVTVGNGIVFTTIDGSMFCSKKYCEVITRTGKNTACEFGASAAFGICVNLMLGIVFMMECVEFFFQCCEMKETEGSSILREQQQMEADKREMARMEEERKMEEERQKRLDSAKASFEAEVARKKVEEAKRKKQDAERKRQEEEEAEQIHSEEAAAAAAAALISGSAAAAGAAGSASGGSAAEEEAPEVVIAGPEGFLTQEPSGKLGSGSANEKEPSPPSCEEAGEQQEDTQQQEEETEKVKQKHVDPNAEPEDEV